MATVGSCKRPQFSGTGRWNGSHARPRMLVWFQIGSNTRFARWCTGTQLSRGRLGILARYIVMRVRAQFPVPALNQRSKLSLLEWDRQRPAEGLCRNSAGTIGQHARESQGRARLSARYPLDCQRYQRWWRMVQPLGTGIPAHESTVPESAFPAGGGGRETMLGRARIGPSCRTRGIKVGSAPWPNLSRRSRPSMSCAATGASTTSSTGLPREAASAGAGGDRQGHATEDRPPDLPRDRPALPRQSHSVMLGPRGRLLNPSEKTHA
jgi:hypothetical protein